MSGTLNQQTNILPCNDQASQVWNAGGDKYERISQQIIDAIAHTVSLVNPQESESVLDVATGSGLTARLLAEENCEVIGLDFSSSAIDAAKKLDTEQRIEFIVGDAESLPFLDGSFDVVTSTFGVMFCGNPELAAAEMARVCKPGGRIAIAVWDQHGGIFDMFQLLSKYKPPVENPPPSPFAWANPDRLSSLFGTHFDFSIQPGTSFYRESSAEETWNVFTQCYGPTKTLCQNLEPDELAQLKTEFIDFHAQYESDGGIVLPRPYLIVHGERS